MTAPLLLVVAFALAAIVPLHAQTATQVWVQRYNGSGNKDDLANAVVVDRAGNVIVTGVTTNADSGSTTDFYTVKYAAANGALLWEKRYDGPAISYKYDRSESVALDSLGNVVVTGYSYRSVLDSDYYTAKYDAVDGTLLWEKRYNSPASGDDKPSALAIDSSDNVIVTGLSKNSGGNNDFCTVKYAAADGALLWEKRYNGPADQSDGGTSLALDGSAYVIVSGASRNANGDSDFYTARYAAADGSLLWDRRYNGPASYGQDGAIGVAVDNAGNVVVTGQTSHINSGYTDYYTAKYTKIDGAVVWEKRYNGPGNEYDFPMSLSVDDAGNAIVTGYSKNAANNYDCYTAKYAAADGILLWEKRYDGPANSDDAAYCVALDSASNVVIAGQSVGLGTRSDYYVAKYASGDGHLLWEGRYNGPANSYDMMAANTPSNPPKLALTLDGGAVITGWSYNGSNYDYATVRFSPPAGDADGDGLQDWWEQMWWDTVAGHAALDDFDRDGIPELLEMAFALNPKKPDNAALPQPGVEAGYLTMTITKRPGVTYQVQSAGSPNSPAFSPTTTTVLLDNAATLKVRDNFPLATNPTRFLRVKVTAAP